jgi:hypothetical protein
MTALTPDAVRRWDTSAISQVFQVANARARSMHSFGENLGQVGQKLAEWEGEAGAAFHNSLGRARYDIDADGVESAKVGAAVSASVADVQACKTMMSEIDSTAESFDFTITPDWRVDIGNAGLLMGATEAQLEQQILQKELDTLNVKAHSTDQELASAIRAAVDPVQPSPDNETQPRAGADPDQAARQRDEAIVHDTNASAAERKLAQERLDDLSNSKLVGPLILDPVTGSDSRTRAQGRREFQQFLESGKAYPDRPPLTPDQATQLIDNWEAGSRQMILNDFGKQLQQAGVSAPGIQRAIGEVQSGKTPAEVFRDAASNMSTYGGGLGGGAESHGKAMPNGQHWGDGPVWSEADAKALEGFGRKLTKAGVGLDFLVTGYDIANGAPVGPAVAELGGRTAGGFAGGFIAGGLWGSFVGPEGTLAVGLAGGVLGSLGGDKIVKTMLGQ